MLTVNDALAVVNKAVELAQQQEVKISVVVVNADGRILSEGFMPGARPMTQTVARLKAEQSAATGKTTRQNRDLLSQGEVTPQVWGIAPEEFIKWAGGVPIYKNGELVGAVGISNLSEDEDERLALTSVTLSHLNVC